MRRFGRDVAGLDTVPALAIGPGGRTVLAAVRNGDLLELVSIPRDGGGASRVLLSLTGRVAHADMAADGSIYVDQFERQLQILRFGEDAQLPETIASVPAGRGVFSQVPDLPDGRYLFTAVFGGRLRLVAAKPTGELSAFVESDQEARTPAVVAGPDRVAFMLGAPPEQYIAIASIKDGRILERQLVPAASAVSSLTVSTDGATFYYADDGSIWSIVVGGQARKLGPGDAVAFDPGRNDLVVQLNESDRVRLARMPASGGPPERIPVRDELAIPLPTVLGPNAVRRDGRVVVGFASSDSWFFSAAVLDPATGTYRRTPLQYAGDFFTLSWSRRGEIVAGGFALRSTVWRFRPSAAKDLV